MLRNTGRCSQRPVTARSSGGACRFVGKRLRSVRLNVTFRRAGRGRQDLFGTYTLSSRGTSLKYGIHGYDAPGTPIARSSVATALQTRARDQ
jgi:hypothetical protein